MRFTYAASDKSRAAGVIKFFPNVVTHHSAFALVFCTGEERSLPLGAAGTASAAVTAHADQFDAHPRDECTLAVVRSLELAWRPQTAMLEGTFIRSMSIPQPAPRSLAGAGCGRSRYVGRHSGRLGRAFDRWCRHGQVVQGSPGRPRPL